MEDNNYGEERTPVYLHLCLHPETTIIDDRRYCVNCGKEIEDE